MIVYCTSKNSGHPSTSESVDMVYLGTSIADAIKSVGRFTRYQKAEDKFPDEEYLQCYTALPSNVVFKLVNYYAADGWWYTIVSFELADTDANLLTK